MTVPRDPGLQPERTALAWRRTVVSALLATLFLWRGAILGLAHDAASPDTGAALAGAVVAAGATLLLAWCAAARIRLLRAGARDGTAAGVGTGPGTPLGPADTVAGALILRSASAAIVALAVAAVWSIAWGL